MPLVEIEVGTRKELTKAQKTSLTKAFKLDVVDTLTKKDLKVVVEYQSPIKPSPKPKPSKSSKRKQAVK